MRYLRELETYIPCAVCTYFDGGRCQMNNSEVPLAVQQVGCGKGEFIPF